MRGRGRQAWRRGRAGSRKATPEWNASQRPEACARTRDAGQRRKWAQVSPLARSAQGAALRAHHPLGPFVPIRTEPSSMHFVRSEVEITVPLVSPSSATDNETSRAQICTRALPRARHAPRGGAHARAPPIRARNVLAKRATPPRLLRYCMSLSTGLAHEVTRACIRTSLRGALGGPGKTRQPRKWAQ